METKGWDRRGIEKPDNERVIVGPHESFNETLKNNTSLLRRLIRNQDLVTELIHLGKQNRTDAALLYLEGLTDPQLLERVRGRLESLSTDYIGGAGVLEQFIEDNPWMPFPQLLVTERPDRAASYLMEGKVLIILDGNPTVLAAPATFYSLLHGAEDYYLRLPYASLYQAFAPSGPVFMYFFTGNLCGAVSLSYRNPAGGTAAFCNCLPGVCTFFYSGGNPFYGVCL